MADLEAADRNVFALWFLKMVPFGTCVCFNFCMGLVIRRWCYRF